MENRSKIGCIIRNEKDPYQFHCVFSADPGDKREYSVYFHSPDERQELMASCTHNERYECRFAREGLSITEDYISVSETFSNQTGRFVCRNGGPALEQFPCLYSGNSLKPEVKCGMSDIGSNILYNLGVLGTEDNNLVVFIGGVVIILLLMVIGFLLWKEYKFRKERPSLHEFIRDMFPEDDSLDRSNEDLKSCNEETGLTNERKQTNGNKILEEILLLYFKENILLNQNRFDEKSSNGETGQTKEYNQTNGQGRTSRKHCKRFQGLVERQTETYQREKV